MVAYRAQKVSLPDGSTSTTVLGPEGLVEPAERYLAFLDDLGRSPHTVRAYAGDIALWFECLSGRGQPWDEADLSDLATFTAYLRRTNRNQPESNLVVLRPAAERADRSVQRTLSAVSGFYDFHAETPLASALRRSRQERENVRHRGSRSRRHPFGITAARPIADHLSPDELVAVLGAPTRIRDRLLLSLMGLNGLRVGAALGLRHEDLSLRKRTLAVVPRTDNANGARAKRLNLLVLPLHPVVADMYGAYLDLEYEDIDSDYVLVNLWAGQRGCPMSYETARSVVNRTAAATGIRFTAHTLRHTFATLLQVGGVAPAATPPTCRIGTVSHV